MAKQGKRLWMRNLNKTWIPLPNGADNDRHYGTKKAIRSVNIWDSAKKRWLTPSPWQSTDWLYWIDPAAPVATLNMYDPDLVWRYTEWYPNRVRNDTWTELTGLRPRNNPYWKIIPFSGRVPQVTGEGGLPAYPYHLYDPDQNEMYNLGYIEPTTSTTAGYPQFFMFEPPVLQGNVIEPALKLCRGGAIADDVSQPQTMKYYHDTAMIDLAILRKFQEDRWPHSLYYTGQYKPMSTMKLKRIVMKGKLGFVCGFGMRSDINSGLAVPETDFAYMWEGFSWRLRYRTSQPSEPVDVSDLDAIRRQYPLRRPRDAQIGTGTIIDFQRSLSDVANSYADPFFTQPGYNTYFKRYEKTFSLTIEDPGEDNVVIGWDIGTSIPIGSGTLSDGRKYPQFSMAVATAAFTRLAFHYATDGHDTPTETHHFPAL